MTPSVAVDLDQPLVADPEMVGDLVQHDPPDLLVQQRRVVTVCALERAAVDRDLVGKRCAVVVAPARQRDALVEPEQALPRRRFVLDHELEVRDPRSQLDGERVQRRLDHRLETVVHPHERSPG